MLLLLIGCGGVCKNGPVEVLPAPWDAIAWDRSETADVCKASATELQHLRTDGTVDAQLAAVEGALADAGWRPEERATNETAVDGAITRSWRTDDVLAEVHVNASFDRKYVVTTVYDKSEVLETLWDKPADFDDMMAAGAAASTAAWTAVSGRARGPATCPEGTTVGPIIDIGHLAILAGKPDTNDFTDFSGRELDELGRHEAGTDYAMDAQYRYSKALAENGAVVLRVKTYSAPGLGQGDVFRGGSASGDVYVVNGDRIVCATTFSAESSETVKSGEQWDDLNDNVVKAVGTAVSAIR